MSFTRRYEITPHYRDFYELGISSDGAGLPSTYQFKGILQLSIYKKGHLIQEKQLNMNTVKYLNSINSDTLKRVSLGTFPLGGAGRDAGDLIVITVLKPELQLKPQAARYKLYIQVSGVP